MKREIMILMHTHWDREWYFTKDETKVLLRNHMQEVLDYLEMHPDAIYILDGQSVMIDDYLEMEPDAEERLRSCISNGQLRVGPWYTQTDLLIVHGESIYRNLYYGIKRAEAFGNPMRVGYAPDTFGHDSQMPQIYSQFGIDSTFFWRGFSELKASKSDFLWEGIDGTRIVGVNLSTGYQGAKYLEEDLHSLEKRMEKIMKVLDNYSAGKARLIMNGHDQMPIQSNIKTVMENLRKIYPDDKVTISDFESYVDALDRNKLEVVKGELIHSKHSRIHKTIGSTRMDIKLLNSEIEYRLYHVLEPLAVIGKDAGIAYPHGVIEAVLKILFGTHAHDSIGGCNSDKVNRDIKQRLLNAREMIDTQIELHLRLMTMAQREHHETLIVVNPLPEKRNDERVEMEMLTRTKGFRIFNEENAEVPYTLLSQSIEDAGLIDRQVAAKLLDIQVYRSRIMLQVDVMKGLSARYFRFLEADGLQEPMKSSEEHSIENQWGRLYLEDNILVYRDHVTGLTHKNIISIENSGDAGDSYDYSPPEMDRIINSAGSAKVSADRQVGTGVQELKVTWLMKVPADILQRETGPDDVEVTFSGKFRLMENSPLIYAEVHHINQVKDSRYRLVLKTDIQSQEVTVDGFLSSQKKPVYREEELSVWQEENWVEKPVSIETCQSYIALQDGDHEAVLYTYGLREYEVIKDEIHLTLFRCFSHLGKRELVNRPGRPSGIEIETPDNELLGQEFTFRFAFSFHKKELNYSREARKYLSPIVGYQRKEFNRFNLNVRKELRIPKGHLSLELGTATVSAVKLTEEKDEIFMRIFNPEVDPVTIMLPEKSFRADAMEKWLEPLKEVTLNNQEVLNIIVTQ